MVKLGDVFIVPTTTLIRRIENRSLLLNLETGGSYRLDEIGTDMLSLIQQERSLQDICDLLLQEYEVDRSMLESDLLALTSELVAAGLLHRKLQ